MEKTALFIGRFQPAHYGHVDALRQIVAKGVTKILIGVGSSNKEFTSENPYTFKERLVMIERLLDSVDDPIIGAAKNNIVPIPDYHNDETWKNNILNNFDQFDYVVTGNARVQNIFKQEAIKVLDLDINLPIKASNIRIQILNNRRDLLEKNMPMSVVDYIYEINSRDRFKGIFHNEMKKPSLCVDGILEDKEGNLILIKRGKEPFGYAIPGGHVDYGEDPLVAVVREIKEETNLDTEVEKLVGVYGKPDRDPREHVVTVVYKLKIIGGELKAGDDAAGIRVVPKTQLEEVDFAFDHRQILGDYYG